MYVFDDWLSDRRVALSVQGQGHALDQRSRSCMEEVALASVAIVASQSNVKGDLRIFEALGGISSQPAF